jgi:dolichyl-phosphate-mannose-protein mannosyltransferase
MSLPLILPPIGSGFVNETNYAGAPMGATNGGRSGERAWTRADWFAILAVTGLAALIRLPRLNLPRSLVFDETYYALDACYYAEGVGPCGLERVPVEVHPPLGKWLISIGIRIFDYNSFGYRIVIAFAGIFTVVLLYMLARKLLGSTLGATLSAGLLAIDPLHFVQSRIAMLDVFVPLFGVAAVLCVVHDRSSMMRERHGQLARPWRAAAGVIAGAAAASKWSGAFFVVLILVLTITWEVAARREGSGWRDSVRNTVMAEGASIALYLLLLPLIVYVATYVGRVEGALVAWPWSEGGWLHAMWQRQVDMASFHFGLEATHPYQSPAWSWILVKRPMSYFYETTPAGDSLAIMAVGNVIVWWSAIPALVFTAFRWIRRRNWRGPEGVILAGVLFTYGPWLIQNTDRAAVFIFYLLPTLPFMMLALGYAASSIGRTWEARAAIGLFAALAIGYFAYFYPVLAETPISYEQFRGRILFERCRVFSDDQPRAEESEDAPPEEGWCWL